MNTETALSISGREVTPAVWGLIKEMAPVMYKSRLFGVSSEEQAIAIMLKGYELGLSITASFELVQVVQGRPSLSPRGAMALMLNSPLISNIKVNRLTNGNVFVGYECTMKRANGFEYTARWTIDDAARAGLVKPDSGWQKYPENMCLWRAIGFAADMVAPDITAGLTGLMKMPEQFGVALSAEGDVIDLQTQPAPAQIAAESVEPTTPLFTLDQLCDMFGAEKVYVANKGKIPATDEELRVVTMKLAGES